MLFLTIVSVSTIVFFAGHLFAHNVSLASWSTDHQRAWRAAQQEHRPLLLYVSSENCVYCRKMVHETLSDQKVAAEIQRHFVPVNVVAEDNRQLVRKLRIKAYPTTVIISPRSVVLDYIPGYIGPDELRTRLAAASRKAAGTRR